MKINIYQPLAIHELGKRANQEDCIYPIEGKATENDRLFLLCEPEAFTAVFFKVLFNTFKQLIFKRQS